MNRHTFLLRPLRPAALIALAALLPYGCSPADDMARPATDTGAEPTATAAAPQAVTIATTSDSWQRATLAATRSGETLDALKSSGFGLFSTRLGLSNQQVEWQTANEQWSYGDMLLWPDNIVKYTITFNGEGRQSKDGYFTCSGADNFDSHFSGCSYQGTDYTQGLRMEAGTTVSWTSGAHGNRVKVTIVQSRRGTGSIQFDDGAALDSTDTNVCTLTAGARIYTVRNVSPGIHRVTRGSGESGLFCITVDIDYTAYAPYMTTFGTGDDDNNGTADGITACDGTTLTFTPALRNTTDLLWAADSVSPAGTVYLNFRHALAKLSLGTVTNNYGCPVTLKSIYIDGTRYTEGQLSLTDGTWSGQSSETIGTGDDINTNIPVGGSIDINRFTIMQIPGPTVDITYTIESTIYGVEVIKAQGITFDQGKDKTVNLTIGSNHNVEVVTE